MAINLLLMYQIITAFNVHSHSLGVSYFLLVSAATRVLLFPVCLCLAALSGRSRRPLNCSDVLRVNGPDPALI